MAGKATGVVMTSAFQGLLVASSLVVFHAPDGHEVYVNPAEITILHQKLNTNRQGNFVESASCMINTSDGKFVTVIEDCIKVLDSIRGAQ
jgi:hypothetical protein